MADHSAIEMWRNTHPAEPYGARGLYIDEPLPTDAPADAQPYCYLFGRIAFYKQPYVVDERGGYAKWDDIQTEWNLLGQRWTDQDIGWAALAPFVLHEGQLYELASGTVIHQDDRWVMRWLAWRVPADDRRLAAMANEAGTVFPIGTRVVTPHGAGTVVKVSPTLKWSHIVKLDATKQEKSYAVRELRATLAPRTQPFP